MRQADGAQLGIAWSNEQVLGDLDFIGDTCLIKHYFGLLYQINIVGAWNKLSVGFFTEYAKVDVRVAWY